MTNEKTKALVKYLTLLAENDFVVLSADFETGQVAAVVPGFDADPKKADPKATDKVFGMTNAEMERVRTGNIIEAIKLIRERTNLGLADAKAVAERYREARNRGEVA